MHRAGPRVSAGWRDARALACACAARARATRRAPEGRPASRRDRSSRAPRAARHRGLFSLLRFEPLDQRRELLARARHALPEEVVADAQDLRRLLLIEAL